MRFIAAAAVVFLLSQPLGVVAQEPSWPGEFRHYEFTSEAGARDYYAYIPVGLRPSAPVMVFLHGCTMTAEQAAIETLLTELADAKRFLLVFPEQSSDANGSLCWNWFNPDHQHRDAGEPALIAGITQEAVKNFEGDRRRVFINGISAGGAMTVIMAATYPEIYAAATVHAACPYRGVPCAGTSSALPASLLGRWAYEEMAERARTIPFLVIQGETDPAVPAITAEQVVEQWLTTDDWVDDGNENGSIPRDAASTDSGVSAAGRTYDIDRYTNEDGCLLVERWLIHLMGHYYSGGAEGGDWTDPGGPDVNSVAYDFFMTHPKGRGRTCNQLETA
jgi:poly(hydroxyalkanoate) depolymerase family esterase